MPKRPKPKRALVYIGSSPKDKSVRFHATAEAADRLRDFGELEHGDEDPTYYRLFVSPLYDFDEVIQYMMELDADDKDLLTPDETAVLLKGLKEAGEEAGL